MLEVVKSYRDSVFLNMFQETAIILRVLKMDERRIRNNAVDEELKE